ncbi:MAG: YigZ family protein [Lachnospirales bacterium]
MLKNYKTTLQYASADIEVKKSKFISQVFQITSENEAIEIIAKVRKEHPKAVHNVFAYMVGYNNEIVRQSDDGEPSGTSGMPTLDILQKEDIKNTLIVTTRYFGGTLLGTGGLVSAYGSCAKLAVQCAVIFDKELHYKVSLKCNYDYHGKLQYYLLNNNYYIEDTIYLENIEMIFYVPYDKFKKLEKDILEQTKGIVKPDIITPIYCSTINEEFKIFEETKEI